MPEQVPEVREAIDREQRRRRAAEPTVEPGGREPAADTSPDRALWTLLAASVVGLVLLALVQAWFMRRPGSPVVFTLFFVAFQLLGAAVVAGVAGLVVSFQLRRHERQTEGAARTAVLVRLHADGEIDDATLGRLVHEIGTDTGVGR